MITLSKTKLKFTSILAVVFLLVFTVSCSKDDDSNDDKPAEISLVATADLNFIDDEEVDELKCYRQGSYGELLLFGDTLFVLRLQDTDVYGDPTGKPVVLINITRQTGIEAGVTYAFTGTQSSTDDMMFSVTKNQADDIQNGYFAFSVSNDNSEYENSGSLTISSLTSNHVEGTFSFTAHTFSEPPKKAEVTNGVFHGDLQRN